MGMRVFVFMFSIIMLFVALGGVFSIGGAWDLLSSSLKLIVILSLFSSLCFVAVAYWVWEDDERLQQLEEQVRPENQRQED